MNELNILSIYDGRDEEMKFDAVFSLIRIRLFHLGQLFSVSITSKRDWRSIIKQSGDLYFTLYKI
jgi:hypothetical protein